MMTPLFPFGFPYGVTARRVSLFSRAPRNCPPARPEPYDPTTPFLGSPTTLSFFFRRTYPAPHWAAPFLIRQNLREVSLFTVMIPFRWTGTLLSPPQATAQFLHFTARPLSQPTRSGMDLPSDDSGVRRLLYECSVFPSPW